MNHLVITEKKVNLLFVIKYTVRLCTKSTPDADTDTDTEAEFVDLSPSPLLSTFETTYMMFKVENGWVSTMSVS